MLKGVQSGMIELQRKFDELHLNDEFKVGPISYNTHTVSAAHGSCDAGLNGTQPAATDRQRNCILFEVPENRDAPA
jgi:hypothetical protein